jgi:hypothetical protein
MAERIASDIGEPGDSALWVEFYDAALPNNFKSAMEGRPVHDDVVMVRIRVPGRTDMEVVRAVVEEDKFRYAMQWAVYQSRKTEGDQGGTPISEIPGISRASVENLRALKFYTVEQVAVASDQALQSMHMKIGMDPHAFRDRCQRYLTAAEEGSVLTRLEQELSDRDARMLAMEGMMKQMQETIKAQQEMISVQTERAGEPSGNKPKAA